MSQREGIFISYRRADSQLPAGALARDLKKVFGSRQVFRDLTDIAPGQRFQVTLINILNSCRVMLVVIGPSWLSHIVDRANQEKKAVDYVVLEINHALTTGVDVIPVLLDGADPPDAVSLPLSIQPLAGLQVHRQTDRKWDADLATLRDHLEAQLGLAPQAAFKFDWSRVRAWMRRATRAPVLVGAAALVLVAVGLAWRATHPPTAAPDGTNVDIAFLVPPEGTADSKHAVRVFNELQGVLRQALASPTVELVPETIAPKDLEDYQLGKEALLTYRSRRGQVDLYIASTNGLDPSSKTRRLVVTPYLRPAQDARSLRPVDGWPVQAFVGPSEAKDVALKAGFELIEFLAAKHLMRLRPQELIQARLSLLRGYRDQLLVRGDVCESLATISEQLKSADQLLKAAQSAASTREIFEQECSSANNGPSALASASALYDRTLGAE